MHKRTSSMKVINKPATALLALLAAAAFVRGDAPRAAAAQPRADETAEKQHGYASVNGLKMYYEIHGAENGASPPLVLLHGGGSTIETTFGKVLPALAKTRRVIALEQQGHGRTADIA